MFILRKIYFSLFLLFPLYSAPGISAYFTPAPTPVRAFDSTAFPERPPESAYEAIVQALQQAEKNIYMVVYEFNIYHLTQILLEKLKKDVKVFLLVEADNLKLPETYFLLNLLHQAGAHIIPDQKKGGIMHNKFVVIDEKTLITGSANYSVNAFFQQYNDVVVIHNPDLAKQYLKRFTELTEKIYRKRSSRPSLEPEVFLDLYEPDITYQVVFSRTVFNPTQIMVQVIETCKKSVFFLIFAFSSRPITEAMKRCLKKKSAVQGIFDNAFESENITRSWGVVPFQILWEAGAGVKYDNLKEKIHHKTLVIDEETVVTGSFNFSVNAHKNNDENYLIIHSPALATQYLTRFRELWKRFPDETLFELYIRDRNRKKTSLSFREYEKRFFSKRISAVQEEIKQGEFRGQVMVVEDGDTVTLELAKSKERITVTLAGIMAPISGSHDLHQEPQAHLAKEALIFLASQRSVIGKVVAGEGFDVHALLYTEDGVSLNAALLKTGMAYPLWYEESIYPEPPPPLTYRNHPAWQKELPRLKEAFEKAKNKKSYLWGKLSLKNSPLEFMAQSEELALQRKLTENQFSLGKFVKNSWIGNRKTGKAYPPNSPTYMEYLRDLKDPKLIFFSTAKNAEAAGYLLRNEKNY